MTAPETDPALGEFVYVRNIVGNPYGVAGSTAGVEYTVAIEALVAEGFMAFAPGSVSDPYTVPLGSYGTDPLNPAPGEWVYVYNSVGTPYGDAGTIVGVEYTTHIHRLVSSGSVTLTLPPTTALTNYPLYGDNTFASLGMVKDLMYAYFGGYDGGPGDYSHLILSDRLRDAIAETMDITYDPVVQALIDEARDYNADTKDARDAALAYRNTASGHATTATTKAGEASTSASAALTSRNEALSYQNTAGTHATTATTQAGIATTRATTATTQAGIATTKAGEADTSRAAAAGHASAAAGSATAADGHADRAEAAANEFDLTATSTTGAPGSSASVTVTGDGPAYGLSLTIPRGDKGDKGDEGDISQAALDAAVASLVDNAPEALNTLSELATSLGNDPNFATTVSTEIGLRAKTSDVNTALAGKADAGAEDTATWDGVAEKPATFPPSAHTHTKAQVGLGNVDNTSDAAKSVSTAAQAALDGKSDVGHKHPVADLTATGTASSSTYLRGDGSWQTPTNTTYSVPTQAEAEAGTATTARAFSAQRVRQAANAAIVAREWDGTQAAYDAIVTKDPNVTYYVHEG